VKTIEQMLRHLARVDVAEFAIASGRLPCVKVGGAYQPVDDLAPTTDAILQMLVSVGGSRYVDALGPKPTQWTMRLEGVGSIAVAAVMRDDKVQARFVVARRDSTTDAARTSQPPEPTAARASKTPSFGGASRTPTAGPSKTPSRRSSRPPASRPSREPRKHPAHDDELTLERSVPVMGAAHRSAPPPAPGAGVVPPDLELTPAPRLSPVAARASAMPATSAMMPGAMREIEFGEEPERPTRPGTAGMSIELDLERAVRDIEVPKGTARDFEFDPDGGRPVASGAGAGGAPETRRAVGGETVVLDDLLRAARAAGASDLHIVAERPLLYRIAGELLPRGNTLDAGAVEYAIMPRLPARCRVTLEKEGSCDFALDHAEHGRFRVNVTRQRTGLKACLRLIPREIPTLKSLGLPPEIAKATEHHQGLIVITGPTGHGKTSTMAAIVDIINRTTTHHIITVEDPVEYVHARKRAMMSQREVGTHTLSFPNALKASLREDPDVIVVGELRDTETVRMALAASETGHLVLGTMNTPSAAKTIDRLIDLFPPADQSQVRMTLAGGLRLIVSQRLLPSVDGRSMVAASELLPGSIALWSLIRDSKTFQIPSLQQRGKGFGIIRLDDTLADLVRAGKTTKEAALAVAESTDELDAVLSGKRQATQAPAAAAAAQLTGGGLLQKAGNLFGGAGKKS
jgi:twitching motility protein PilT